MPKQNNLPTPEELKTAEEEAIKTAEEIEKNGIPVEINEEEEEEAKKEAGVEDEKTEVDTQTTEEGEEKEEPTEETTEEQADPSKELYKKKFSESSKEAQKIHAKNRVINKALADAEDVDEPTEEELTAIYPDWDILSDFEKNSAKEMEISKRWRATIKTAKDQASKIEQWNKSVEDFSEDPKTLNENPDLEGKIEEFKAFAKLEDNNSVPFRLLVSAFLFETNKTKPTNKGKMFEKGVGGEKPEVKKNTITLEEAKVLRETNYPAYREKLEAGLIEMNL